MPYLTKKRIAELKNPKAKVLGAGDLTYLMTKSLLDQPEGYSVSQRLEVDIARYMPDEPRYENYAVVLGCLASTKMEYERRIVAFHTHRCIEELDSFAADYYMDVIAPYEDKKIQENGDVF